MVFHPTADDAIVVDPFLLAFLPGAIPFLAVTQRGSFRLGWFFTRRLTMPS
jgi:hypothetical protein